ncbi:MAG TPA: DUF1232 domain-containing protein [Candidatus Marinimicrobia bacterium]|jgi:uncharacterized membrane protein YkvA (DUF1232 family)|nr:DUF1232 domain-containing protein [Candidatus Neomarinimicrobiota bacterium]HIB26672.1 DUF1232 domain-containing protein [Candidatus Neomarinimicrobiota bacterium]HIB33879.1 DUF1232 domain-containing protein [Candidatus Neomarinimicrobiota bacterium]HIM74387.1 DUF1232 domain-containing protein [Candidatus Neomarinimicrobiota bacterium]
MNPSDQLQLTAEDKARYEKRISEIDLNDIPMVLKEVPKKIESLVSRPNLFDYQVILVSDISKLLSILKDLPELNEDLKKRIVFALEYFLEELDEIPDSSPLIGLLDDYVLVRWVVDSIMAEYSELFEA